MTKWLVGIVFALSVLGYLGWTYEPESQSGYPSCKATYPEVDAQVGCASEYSHDKKDGIFRSRYKNRWMTWSGVVVRAEGTKAALNINGKGTHDLMVKFSDRSAGWELARESVITVTFLMKRAGGCTLPFSGDKAMIVE